MLEYFSTYHWKVLVNGHSGYRSPNSDQIFEEMQGFPSDRSIDLLRGLTVDLVIWHREWLDPQEANEQEARLLSQPGLTVVRDFGDQVVFLVEHGELAPASDLEVSLTIPGEESTGEEEPVLQLLVRNPSVTPFVAMDEDPQLCTVRFMDEEDEIISQEQGHYRAPLFLESGDEVLLPIEFKKSPPENVHRIEVDLEGGVLGERALFAEL